MGRPAVSKRIAVVEINYVRVAVFTAVSGHAACPYIANAVVAINSLMGAVLPAIIEPKKRQLFELDYNR